MQQAEPRTMHFHPEIFVHRERERTTQRRGEVHTRIDPLREVPLNTLTYFLEFSAGRTSGVFPGSRVTQAAIQSRVMCFALNRRTCELANETTPQFSVR